MCVSGIRYVVLRFTFLHELNFADAFELKENDALDKDFTKKKETNSRSTGHRVSTEQGGRESSCFSLTINADH